MPPRIQGYGIALIILAFGISLIAACSPSTETLVVGDRNVVQVTAGALRSGDGNRRLFFILRDPDTGVDYLAVADAGIIKLEPKPALQPEKTK